MNDEELNSLAIVATRMVSTVRRAYPEFTDIYIEFDSAKPKNDFVCWSNVAKQQITIALPHAEKLELALVRRALVHEIAHHANWQCTGSLTHDNTWRDLVEHLGEDSLELFKDTRDLCGPSEHPGA